MKRRDIILARALYLNKGIHRTVNVDNAVADSMELDSTSQNPVNDTNDVLNDQKKLNKTENDRRKYSFISTSTATALDPQATNLNEIKNKQRNDSYISTATVIEPQATHLNEVENNHDQGNLNKIENNLIEGSFISTATVLELQVTNLNKIDNNHDQASTYKNENNQKEDSYISTVLERQATNLNEIDNNPSIESYISLEPPSYSPITPQNFNRCDIQYISGNNLQNLEYSPVRTMSPDILGLILSDSSNDSQTDQNFVVIPETSSDTDSDFTEISNNIERSMEEENCTDSPVRPMSPDILGLILSDSSNDTQTDPNFVVIPETSSDTDSDSILIRQSDKRSQSSTEISNNIERSIEEENCTVNIIVNEDVTTQKAMTGRPKKGRKRKFEEYTLAERKSRKYANLPYKGKNKEVRAKIYQNFECDCKYKCHLKITEEERKKEFEKFVTLGSYEAQLLYICSNVTEKPKNRTYVPKINKSGSKKLRQFSRTYKISDIPVCRNMFIKTFQITTQKVTISLKKQRDGKNLHDCRGIASSAWNKTSEEDIDFVCDVINKLPKYESHYRRSQIGDAKYLKPGLTLQKTYDLYVEEFKKSKGNEKKHLSLAVFRKIFLTRFNLRFKSLKKDTCNKCDAFAAKLKTMPESEEKNCLLSEKERHLQLAETLRSQMNSHIERAKVDNTFECITYDMEKTLPLPRIPTNIVFYKRQLWFYNCGIHVSSTNQGYCFVWIEGEAGRGAQEVGSCLMKFINQTMRPEIEHLSLWSDSCGGQNRNIKMVLLLKVVLAAHPSLKTIELNFLESGHTFLPNDTDFGKIEANLKNFQRLYTADDYITVIKTCQKKIPLVPIKMVKEDFLSTENLEKNITNRKTFVNKDKVNWLKTKNILLKKESLYSVFMKTELDDYQELNISRKVKGDILPISTGLLFPLWPQGKPINNAKLNDLKSMFHLIPEDCLSFYKNLKGMKGLHDDIEGFGARLDFELEDEVNQDND